MKRLLSPWSSLAALPRSVHWVVAISFVNRLGAAALPFLMLYLRDRAIPLETAGTVLSLYGAVSFLAAPVAGRLVDRFGARAIMPLALVGNGIVLCVVPSLRTLPSLYLATALWAFTGETFRPASMTLLAEASPPEQRKRVMAYHRLALNLAGSGGPALAGFLATRGIANVFYADGFTSLCAAATAAFVVGTTNVGRDDDAAKIEEERAPLPRRNLVLAVVGLFTALLLFFQLDATYGLYVVDDCHLSPVVLGLLFFANTVIVATCEVPLVAAIEKRGYAGPLAIGGLLAALGFGLHAVARSPAALLGALVLWTGGEMIVLPLSSAYVTDIAPKRRRGVYLAVLQMTFGGALTVAPLLGTWLTARFGWAYLWAVLAAIAAVGSIAFFFLREPNRVSSQRLVDAS